MIIHQTNPLKLLRVLILVNKNYNNNKSGASSARNYGITMSSENIFNF